MRWDGWQAALGILIGAGGVAFYDWRAGLVTAGAVLLADYFLGAWLAARKAKR